MPVPPQGVRAEAERGLEWRREYGRGGTLVGVARARDLAGGADVSTRTLNRMVSFFARHEVDKRADGWSPGEPGYPSAGRIAWALWGGDAGRRWALAETRQSVDKDAHDMDRRPGRLRKLRITRVDRVTAGANPDAHVVLFKRAELTDDPPTTVADVIDYPTDMSADERVPDEEQNMTDVLTDVTTDEPTADDRIAEIEAERDAALAKIAEYEAATANGDDDDEDEVLKSLDPSVRERIAKAEADRAALADRVAKMEDEAATREFVAKAAEFAAIDNDADRLGAVLKDVATHCDATTVDALQSILKNVNGRLDEAHRLVTAELGSAAAIDATDAGRQIESLAKARSAETGESMPVATAAILNANPDLYEQARAQRGL